MRNFILLAVALTTAFTTNAQCGLFFSEAAEGTSNNKYLEIYNPTDVAVDLTTYAFPSVSNAPAVVGEYEYWNTFPAGAMIAAGGTYVISHGSADATLLAGADHTHTYLSNGDDGYMLVLGTETDFVQIDAIGDWNGDPGDGWDVAGVAEATKDHTLRRKSDVAHGNGGDWTASAGTNETDSEWLVLEIDYAINNAYEGYGSHEFTGSCGAPSNACGVTGVVVEAVSYTFTPAAVSVAVGGTVVWVNNGGNHDVNGAIDSQTGVSFGNPADFAIGSANATDETVCIGSQIFDVPGVYNYDCSIGNHAAQGMVGTVTVGTGGCMDALAANYSDSADYDDDSCEYASTQTISAIQQNMGDADDGTLNGTPVEVYGIVTAVFGSSAAIQDGEGAWSGIFLYQSGGFGAAQGDSVIVSGTVGSYNGGTQISVADVTVLNSGNTLPTAAVVSTLDAASEAYEGVLCRVTASITGEPDSYGQFTVDDGSGPVITDDLGYDAYSGAAAALGETYRITGPVYGSFGNSLEPRDADDFQKLGCTNSGAPNYDPNAVIDDDSCLIDENATAIVDIQMGQVLGNFEDSLVTLNGVVTGIWGSLFTVQEGTGAYSGIFGYNPEVTLALGDFISATGVISEYSDLTQITGVDGNPIAVAVLTQGNDLPAAEVLGTGAASDEQWEGVRVQTTGVCDNADLGYGEWSVDDASGATRIDDRGYDAIGAGLVEAGASYQVTAPMHYNFGDFKLIPMTADEVLKFGCTNPSADNFDAMASIDDGSCTGGAACDLFFSEYGEGSSNNKYMEIFNPTDSDISLAQYNMANQSNGANNTDATAAEWDYWTLNFPAAGSVPAGGTFLIVHPSADAALVAEADMTYNYLSNGDDAWGLVYSETISWGNGGDWTLIDVVGEPYGSDPGSSWAVAGVSTGTVNHTLIRKSSVVHGNPDWAAGAGTTAEDSEWIVLASDTAINNGLFSINNHDFTGLCQSDDSGCTDPLALNYDSTALVDDGSCIFVPNVTIQEIRSGEATGLVITTGVVTGVYLTDDGSFGNKASFTVQNGTGALSGIWVQGTDGTAEGIGNVAVGDEVQLLGSPSDWYGLANIPSPEIVILSSGNALPAAEVLATNDVNLEDWEGVYSTVTAPCTTADFGYGEFGLDDGSGVARVNDRAYNAVDAGLTEVGVTFRVTAPIGFAYGNWKLEPRDSSDVVRLGCMDSAYPNYDALATEDDGSCSNIPGCTNPAADNYNPDATADDGSCVITGCDDPAALNYDAAVTVADNASCYYTLPSILINEIHYNPCGAQGADFDWEFAEFVNTGDADVDLSGFELWTGNTPALAFVFADGTIIAAGAYFLLVPGPVALANYSGNGYQVFEMSNGNYSNSGSTVTLMDGFGNIVDEVVYDDASPWPADEVSIQGVVIVSSPDGGCGSLELIAEDLDNSVAVNWQSSWVSNGTPGMANSSAFGCADGQACNYTPAALLDDGSCTYDCFGCTYESATNYDAAAILDDGSCELSTENPCPTDLNGDGTTSVSDLLMLLGAFSTPCEE
jgi:predicted extracellular nuclease